MLEWLPLAFVLWWAGVSALVVAGSTNGSDAGVAFAVLLFLAALGIYFIWSLSLYGKGQSPGKFLLGLRIVKVDQASAARFGTCFLREIIAKPLISMLSIVTAGIVNFWLLWDQDTQELWDKVVGTIVVNDRSGWTLRSG